MPSDVILQRDDVNLAGLDFGGEGTAALLLHGLAGHAGEWKDTAAWLTERSRVVAFDARGHGASQRGPRDVSLRAHAADATYAIEQLGLAPAVVVGQSLGGLTAMLVAATRPDLVLGLVIVDADPEAGDDGTLVEVERWLRAWPVPFPSREAAAEFFNGSPVSAEAWANGLERGAGGWWPRFDIDVLTRTLRDALSRSYWSEWERITCPALVVRGENGEVDEATARAMAGRLKHARLIELADAGHDLHLDRPAEWRTILSGFFEFVQITAG